MNGFDNLNICNLESYLEKTSTIIANFRNDLYSDSIIPSINHNELYLKLYEDVPEYGCPLDTLFSDIQENIIPSFSKIGHPRNLAWMNNSSCDAGIIGEVLNVGFGQMPFMYKGSPSATVLEEMVIKWFCGLFALGNSAGGTLTSGGMTANLIGLTAARTIKGEISFSEGLNEDSGKLVLYISEQGHSTIERAIGILGIGTKNIRRVELDSKLRMNTDDLESKISKDIESGLKPFCVVAQAGSASSGTVDPLREIAGVCNSYNLWFHVDAAYGGAAILTDKGKRLLDGIKLADSITFDPHKWLYMPLEAGMLLVKNKEHLYNTFNGSACALYKTEEDEFNLVNYGIQYARNSKALKIWFAIKHYGMRKITQMVEANLIQAQYLKQKLNNYSCWRLLIPVDLSIVTFQYLGECNLTDDQTSDLQKKIVNGLMVENIAFLSCAEINGKIGIRICFANHRTITKDIYLILTSIMRIGKEIIEAEMLQDDL